MSPTLICGEAEPAIPFKALSKNESQFIATHKNSDANKCLSEFLCVAMNHNSLQHIRIQINTY